MYIHRKKLSLCETGSFIGKCTLLCALSIERRDVGVQHKETENENERECGNEKENACNWICMCIVYIYIYVYENERKNVLWEHTVTEYTNGNPRRDEAKPLLSLDNGGVEVIGSCQFVLSGRYYLPLLLFTLSCKRQELVRLRHRPRSVTLARSIDQTLAHLSRFWDLDLSLRYYYSGTVRRAFGEYLARTVQAPTIRQLLRNMVQAVLRNRLTMSNVHSLKLESKISGTLSSNLFIGMYKYLLNNDNNAIICGICIMQSNFILYVKSLQSVFKKKLVRHVTREEEKNIKNMWCNAKKKKQNTILWFSLLVIATIKRQFQQYHWASFFSIDNHNSTESRGNKYLSISEISCF